MDKVLKYAMAAVLMALLTGCMMFRDSSEKDGVKVRTVTYYGFNMGIDSVGLGYKRTSEIIVDRDMDAIIESDDDTVTIRKFGDISEQDAE